MPLPVDSESARVRLGRCRQPFRKDVPLRSIIVASILSLAITFGGYVGVVKLTSKRNVDKKPAEEELTKEDVAAAELQLKGAAEQKGLLVGVQSSLTAMQANMDIATNVLLEEQRKLEALHQSIAADKVAMKEINEQALRKLAKLYESMKPADAAQIASQLETDLVVEIIPRMNERSAAKMLSAMDVQRAVEITSLIAERKKPPARDKS